MWVALFVMLGLGATYLRMAPPPAPRRRHEIEDTFWRGTSWSERRAFHTLASRLQGATVSFASLDLRQLVVTSNSEFVQPRGIRTAAQGPRDLCLVDLPDGATLRLTVFDDRNAARFARAWSSHDDLGVRLRWVEGVGWQCSLHPGVGVRAGAVASVYGWLADVDRSHLAITR